MWPFPLTFDINVYGIFRRNGGIVKERITDGVLVSFERVYREHSRSLFGSVHGW